MAGYGYSGGAGLPTTSPPKPMAPKPMAPKPMAPKPVMPKAPKQSMPKAPKGPGRGGKGGGKGQRGRGGAGKFAGPGVPLNSPILDPSKPLSGQALYNAASALSNAQTQGPLAELQNSIAQNNRQTRGAINLTGGYLNSLGNFAKQGVADEQNIAGNLNLGLGIIGAGEQKDLQGLGQGAQNQLATYTPQSGQGASLASPAMQSLTQELARQQGLAAQQQGAFKASGAVQGANYSGLAAQNLGSDALAGTQTLKGISQAGEVKNEPLNAKIADLKAQKGALTAADLGKLRLQEITNRFTAQGLGLKQQGLRETASNDRARNALAQRAQDVAIQNNLINQQIKWAQLHQKTGNDAATQAANQATLNLGWYKATHGGGGRAPAGGSGRPLSTSQNNAWFAKLGEVEGLVKKAHSNGQRDPNAIRSALETGNGTPHGTVYDPLMVETAFQLLGYGSIDRSQAALLHNAGYRGGSYNGAPIKVTPNYHPKPSTPAQRGVGNAVGNLFG